MAFTDVTDGSRIILQGIGPVKIVLGADVLPGDLLAYNSGWVLADGSNQNTTDAFLVAGYAGLNGDTITAYHEARISGITSGTAGATLYASDTAGDYSITAGTVGKVVGFELGGGEIYVKPMALGGEIIPGAVKLFFRDSGLYIHSNADGKLTISADGAGVDDITLSGKVTIDDDVVLAAGKSLAMSGASTLATGTGAITLSGNVTVATAKTLNTTDADALKSGGNIVPDRLIVTVFIGGTLAATAGNYGAMFVADRAYELLSFEARHETAGNDGGAVTIEPEKCPSGTAKGSGTAMASGTINMKATADTHQSTTIKTDGSEDLADGDTLTIKATGTFTTTNGVVITAILRPK